MTREREAPISQFQLKTHEDYERLTQDQLKDFWRIIGLGNKIRRKIIRGETPSEEEERDLALCSQLEGEIIEANTSMLEKLGQRVFGSSFPLVCEDAICLGQASLLKVVRGYRLKRGKFFSYAFPIVKRDLVRSNLHKESQFGIKTDERKRREIALILAAIDERTEVDDCRPTLIQVCKETGLSKDKVRNRLIEMGFRATPFSCLSDEGLEDEFLTIDRQQTAVDRPTENIALGHVVRDQLRREITVRLKPKAIEILENASGYLVDGDDSQTDVEVAGKVGCSRQNVRSTLRQGGVVHQAVEQAIGLK